eukprot:3641202-Pleurochrysis_carterae.AAC.1
MGRRRKRASGVKHNGAVLRTTNGAVFRTTNGAVLRTTNGAVLRTRRLRWNNMRERTALPLEETRHC